MTDLVTDAAIDAAIALTPLYGRSTNERIVYRYNVRKQLERAAPFIAAEALRQSVDQAEDNYYKANGYADNDANEICVDIRRMADELEASAAFTAMVQQGQEIGEE